MAGYRARIESLNAELGKAHQTAQKKHEDCGVLERQLQEIQEKVDALPLLQTQACKEDKMSVVDNNDLEINGKL